jgi:hypothetical protein
LSIRAIAASSFGEMRGAIVGTVSVSPDRSRASVTTQRLFTM